MRLLIAILTCGKHEGRANAQRLTWVKDAACDVRFFLGRGQDRKPRADEVFLDVDDDYGGLPTKLQLALAWARSQGYTHIAKTDDDVYLQPDRLLKSTCHLHDYWGRVRGASGGYPATYCSGFLYVLSARAADVVIAAQPKDVAEDRFVGNTLHAAGIEPVYDSRLRLIASNGLSRSALDGVEGPREGNALIAVGEFEHVTMFEMHRQWHHEPSKVTTKKLPAGPLDRVCLVIKTFLRDGYLKETVKAVMNYLPEVRMVIVDDGRNHRDKISMYALLTDLGHTCLWLPFDSGFGAKANAAIPYMDRPYILIGSDDFDFKPRSVREGLERMIAVLDAVPDVSIASGRVNDNPYEGTFEFPEPGRVREVRGYHSTHLTPSGIEYSRCDITVNYSMMRREVFHNSGIRWDGGEVKIGGGEHGAFFLDIFRADLRTVYVPGVTIKEFPLYRFWMHPKYPEMRGRARRPGRPCFKKRGVDFYDLFDGGTETC